MIGHSLGEITGACAADVISLDDAMRLVAARGALMHRMPSGGAMASIWAEESVVRQLIDKIAPTVTVAAMNGPLNTVVSGDRDALSMLVGRIGPAEHHLSGIAHLQWLSFAADRTHS